MSMPPKNATRSRPKGSRSTRPKGPFGKAEGSTHPEVHGSLLYYEGYHWFSTASPVNLRSLRGSYDILDSVVLEVPEPRSRVVDSEGFAERVTLFPSMFANGLRLPFCWSVHNVMDYLRLALLSSTRTLDRSWSRAAWSIAWCWRLGKRSIST